MVRKMAIRVCPKMGCTAISSQPEAKCPTHGDPMIRRVYKIVDDFGTRDPMAKGHNLFSDIADGLFGGSMPGGKKQR